jgi:hypothetical protein
MFKGHISFFYYNKIVGKINNFKIIVTITKNYFKTKKNY